MRGERGIGRFVQATTLIGILISGAAEAELVLAVHPILPERETQRLYRPLAAYLARAAGESVRVTSSSNLLTHWHLVRRGDYDLVIDGPHFTDYRNQRLGYTVLGKFPEVVSYTLVANQELFVLETEELVGKTIATLPSPALGALRLSEMFPNPLRQPMILEADDSESAAEMVASGRAAAAIIPTPLVGRYPTLTTVRTTDQVPAPGVSVSPKVAAATREALRQALLRAPDDPQGRAALEAIGIARFEAADETIYKGQMGLLQGMWGY